MKENNIEQKNIITLVLYKETKINTVQELGDKLLACRSHNFESNNIRTQVTKLVITS